MIILSEKPTKELVEAARIEAIKQIKEWFLRHKDRDICKANLFDCWTLVEVRRGHVNEDVDAAAAKVETKP